MKASMFKRAICIGVLLAAPFAQAQVSLDNEAGSSFKGTAKVAIAQFGVEFYTQMFAVGRAGGNTARQQSNLKGVSDATMQAVVDKLYADTVARLKAAGFEVVDAAVLAADPGYQAYAAALGKPSPLTMHDTQGLGDGEHVSKVFAPAGMPAFYASGGSSGGFLRGNMTDRFASQNYGNAMKEAEVAKRLGATMLKFSFLASYGTTTASKNGLVANFAPVAARVAIDTAPVLQAHDTQVQWVDAGGARQFGNIRRSGATGAIYLDKPLKGENIFEIAETTAAATKKDDGVANAVFSLFGAKNGVKSQAVEVTTSDARFLESYNALLSGADEALVGALKNAR